MSPVTTLPETTTDDHAAHYRSTDALDACLPGILAAPPDLGTVELLVRRPAEGVREVLDHAHLSFAHGVDGDTWIERGSRKTPDRSSHPEMQVTLMSARAADAVAGSRDRWAWAGDQIFVDLDLREETLAAGSRLAIGSAVVEVSAHPHTGCVKFRDRFGKDAFFWVNTPEGRAMRLRGLNAQVVTEGTVRVGDLIHRV